MILRKKGESIVFEGTKFQIGDKVISRGLYGDLNGEICEIRTEEDMDTENDDIDIYVDFEIPESEETVKKIEDRFSKLYECYKQIDDLGLDLVIMAPEELIVISDK